MNNTRQAPVKIKGGTLTAPAAVLDAERAVLGCMLVEAPAAREATDRLEAADFFLESHQHAFKAAAAVLERDRSVDVVTLSEALRADGKLQLINAADGNGSGIGYLTRCIDTCVTTAHVKYYAQLVKEASYDRQLVVQAHRFLQEKTPEAARRLQELLVALHGVRHDRILDFRKDLPEIIEELQNSLPPSVDLGFPGLDDALGGVEPGDLVTVGARTNGGKTAIMTAAAYSLASRGEPVLYVTTEMTRTQMVCRVLPMAARIPSWKFRKRKLEAADWAKLQAACADRLSKMPLMIHGKSVVGLDDIRAAAAQTKAKVVFVDYLQRCRLPQGSKERNYQVMDFMVGLKSFAQEAGVVVVIGCQLARQMDKAPDVEPENADLKDSGAIEAESDQVVLLWKPTDKQLRKDPEWTDPGHNKVCLSVKVSKNRHGRVGYRGNLLLDTMLVEVCEREAAAVVQPRQESLGLGGESDGGH